MTGVRTRGKVENSRAKKETWKRQVEGPKRTESTEEKKQGTEGKQPGNADKDIEGMFPRNPRQTPVQGFREEIVRQRFWVSYSQHVYRGIVASTFDSQVTRSNTRSYSHNYTPIFSQGREGKERAHLFQNTS